jgi:O-palmitoleoyl-L-serine hydrolase
MLLVLPLLGLVTACAFPTNVEAVPYMMKKLEIEDGHLVGAMCNDGSKFAYYYEAYHEEAQKNQWVFYLGGGDLCWDMISCLYRQEHSPDKMSSKNLKAYKLGKGIMSPFEEENPTLYGANHVYMPYCSSDLWSGTGMYVPSGFFVSFST